MAVAENPNWETGKRKVNLWLSEATIARLDALRREDETRSVCAERVLARLDFERDQSRFRQTMSGKSSRPVQAGVSDSR